MAENRIRSGPPSTPSAPASRCATFSTICRRGESSCVPNAPSSTTSTIWSSRSRWPARLSRSASATTARSCACTSRCARHRSAWAGSPMCSARNSSPTACVSNSAAPAWSSADGSGCRPHRDRRPTSNTSMSTAAWCVIAWSPMRCVRPMPTFFSTGAIPPSCCFSSSIRRASMSTCIRPRAKCVSASRG